MYKLEETKRKKYKLSKLPVIAHCGQTQLCTPEQLKKRNIAPLFTAVNHSIAQDRFMKP